MLEKYIVHVWRKFVWGQTSRKLHLAKGPAIQGVLQGHLQKVAQASEKKGVSNFTLPPQGLSASPALWDCALTLIPFLLVLTETRASEARGMEMAAWNIYASHLGFSAQRFTF